MYQDKIRYLTYGALMIALVFVTTFSIKIPIPFTQGYIHAGDSMIFVAAILLGWKYGALAGGVGSALADVLGGFANWALPTLIIKAVMGGLVGWIAHDKFKNNNNKSSTMLSISLALVWFVITQFMRSSLGSVIIEQGSALVGEIEGVATMADLLKLTEKLQGQLLLVSIIIPLLIIAFSLYLRRKDKGLFQIEQLLGMMVAGLWMVLGYYLAAAVMYGSYVVPIFSIPWNIVQFVGGGIIAYLILPALRKTPLFTDLP